MQALAARGDVAAAVQAYRALRLHLHQELNVLPSAETIALYQRIQSEARRTVPRAVPPGRLPNALLFLPLLPLHSKIRGNSPLRSRNNTI